MRLNRELLLLSKKKGKLETKKKKGGGAEKRSKLGTYTHTCHMEVYFSETILRDIHILRKLLKKTPHLSENGIRISKNRS